MYMSQEMPKLNEIINIIHFAAVLSGLSVGYSIIGKKIYYI